MFDVKIMEKNKKNSMTFFSLALALMPILNNYQFMINGIGIGDVLIAFSLLNILIKRRSIRIKGIYGPLVIFFLYSFLISIITIAVHDSFSFRDVIVRMTIFASYTIIICMPSNEDFITESFSQIYTRIAFVCCIFLVIQFISFHLFGKIVLGIIPGVPLNYSIRNYSELAIKYGSMYSYFYKLNILFILSCN